MLAQTAIASAAKVPNLALESRRAAALRQVPSLPGIMLGRHQQHNGHWGMVAIMINAKVLESRQDPKRERQFVEGDRLFRMLVESVRDYAIFMLDPDGHVTSWNKGARQLKGYEENEIIGRHFSCFYLKDDIEQGKPDLGLRTAALEGRFEDEGWRQRKDGTRFWASVIISAMRDESGQLHGFAKITRDMTERHRVAEALMASNARVRDFLECSVDDWVWETGPDLRITYVHAKAGEILGREPAFFIGKRWSEIRDGEYFRDQARLYLRAVAARRPFWDTLLRVSLPGKAFRIIRLSGRPYFDEHRTFRGYRGTGDDVTEQERRELEHGALTQRLQLQFEQMPVGCVITDPKLEVVDWNPAAERIFGLSREEALGRSVAKLVAPLDSQAEFEEMLSPGSAQVVAASSAVTNVTKLGREIRCTWTNSPLLDADGNFLGLLCMIQDVTDLEATEAQLRRSQKMEAIGQLAGGIAHDFNNLLTTIVGSLALIEMDFAKDGELSPPHQDIMRAADRGAALTHRLLAIARRQTLRPRSINLNQLITGMEDLLRRTLTASIEVEMVIAPGLWLTLADPGQVENTLLNLVINARDAMPEGGKLTLETANVRLDQEYADTHSDVTPGSYVMLAVTDTGVGMPQEVIEHAFEPFFSTKASNRGSGLGLSMVYGFAKQSGGHVNIYSELSHGTTVRVFLPRSRGPEAAAKPEPAAQDEVVRGREAILVVEDDPAVLATAVNLLTGLGYNVLGAANGPDALDLLNRDVKVELLFTDVVIPGGLSGPALAQEMAKRQPGLKVLYTSGYTENAIVHQGKVDDGVDLLNKPYKQHELARKVRAVLERSKSES